MGAGFRPLGGGVLGKVEAFDILATWLNIEEKSIGEIRRDVFRVVFELGRSISYQAGRHTPESLQPEPESWAVLGGLYEALARLEEVATAGDCARNLETLLNARRDQVESEA